MDPAPFRQRVPRPPSARPGPPPPWAALSAERRASVSVARIVEVARPIDPRDPIDARDPRLGAREVEPLADDDTGADAAVLVPIFASGHDTVVVLIRRAEHLNRDAGHVAFPGGRVEKGEAPVDAALREAQEEIGLARSDVAIEGLLEIVRRPPDERIAVFLGRLDRRPTLVANPAEVESVIEVSLTGLLEDGVAWQERWQLGAVERSVHFFADRAKLGDDLIWGVSARILWHLLDKATARR